MRRIVVTAVAAWALGGCAQEARQGAAQQTPQAEETGPQKVAISAVEYEFQGIPETIEAGEVTFTMKNHGNEPHHFEMVRIKGGKSIEELLQLPGNKANKFIEEAGFIKTVKPGQSGETTIELAAGKYGYVCFIETPDGKPHALNGMYGEFTVA